MARRRLEAAIRAGRAIDTEQRKNTGTFTKVKELVTIELGEASMGTYSLQFSHDGEVLAVGTGNGGIQLFNSRTGALSRALHRGDKAGLPVMCLSFHPGLRDVIVSAGSDGIITLWNVTTATRVETVIERGNEINALDFSLLGGTYATAGKDQCVRLYHANSNKLLRVFQSSNSLLPAKEEVMEFGHGQRIFALKFHPDDDHIFVTGGWDNCLKVWDTRTEQGVQRTISGPHICGSGLDVKDGKILTASWVQHDALQIWDFSSGQLDRTLDLDADKKAGDFLYCAQFCDNNVVLAGGSGTSDVQAINSASFEILGTIDLAGKPIQALDSTDGGKLFAVGGASDILRLASLR
ncbi:uncharacterized protein [Diadema antillarum]|uniref:uncharacterized protein n=1 Tax=Diadema antillarum TaxID=105358 RepID=UPI003A85FC67